MITKRKDEGRGQCPVEPIHNPHPDDAPSAAYYCILDCGHTGPHKDIHGRYWEWEGSNR